MCIQTNERELCKDRHKQVEKTGPLRALRMLSHIMTEELRGYLKPWASGRDPDSAPSPY